MEINQFEFYEKQYFHELTSRDRIQSLLQIPFAIVASLVAILASFIKDYQPAAGSDALVLGFLLAGNLFLLFSVGKIFLQCFHGHSYECLPFANVISNYRDELIGYYEQNKEAEEYDPIDKADKHIQKTIQDYYIKCAAYNAQVNTYRGYKWHSLIPKIIYLMVLVAVTYVYFNINDLDGKKNASYVLEDDVGAKLTFVSLTYICCIEKSQKEFEEDEKINTSTASTSKSD